MKEIINKFKNLLDTFLKAIKKANELDEIKQLEKKFLGKNSFFAEVSREMKTYSAEEKKEGGKTLSEFKKTIEKLVKKRERTVEQKILAEKLEKEWIDITKYTSSKSSFRHPLSRAQEEIEAIFSSMGFEIADGPQIESELNNFDALNIPADHPARDMQDTFWLAKDSENSAKNFVLRTQTSNVQIRSLQKKWSSNTGYCSGESFSE